MVTLLLERVRMELVTKYQGNYALLPLNCNKITPLFIFDSRVGDSPIPGAGAYAEGTVGAAVATGDGDVMMRFLPSLIAVEHMRNNASPEAAARAAIARIIPYYPDFVGAVVAVNKMNAYGAACHGMDTFPYSVYTKTGGLQLKTVECVKKI